MKKHTSLRSFYHNDAAVSEEFTALPAIAVVMIGFTLFILLVANVYQAYEERIDSIQKYQTADFIATKLTNKDSPFIQSAGIIQYMNFKNFQNEPTWNELQKKYKSAGIGFMLKLTWDTGFLEVKPSSSFNLATIGNRVAVSRDISIQLNPAETVPGKLTIITWKV